MKKAVGQYVLISPKEKTQFTPGGIRLPETVKPENPVIGQVVSVGAAAGDRDDENSLCRDYNPGDMVYFDGYQTFAVGENLVAVRHMDIIAVSK